MLNLNHSPAAPAESAECLYTELENKKVKLWLENGSLRYKAPKGVMTAELLAKIGGRKDELVAYLLTLNDRNVLFDPIEPVEEKEYYPLSAAQKRMFVLNRLDRESTAYNTTIALKIEGEFSENRLSQVIEQLSVRHESLRTTFEMIDGAPVQKIHDSVDFTIENAELATGQNIEDVIKEFVRPYDLSRLPLFRAKLVLTKNPGGQDEWFLLFDIHHIISDGVSAAIIIKEINALYDGQSLPELKIQYKDYAAWHELLLSSGVAQKERAFWINQLKGELPVLDLPCDYPRPLKFDTEGKSLHYLLSRGLTDRLNRFARENKVTLFTVLLSAYNMLLGRYSGQNDVIVGTPIAGRVHEDTNGVVGIFLNTLALRNFPQPEKTTAAFIKEVGKNCLKAFDHQNYPFDRLVEDLNIKRDTGRNPVFSTMFVMQNMDTQDVSARGMKTSRYEIQNKMAQVDVTLNVTENREGIDCEINYCTHLFRHETMERFIRHYANILEYIVKNPESTLSKIELLADTEKEQLLYTFNDTARQYPANLTLHALFEQQAAKTPQATAVAIGQDQLTYRELNEKANRLARTLLKKGARPDDIIGVLSEPSLEMIVAILAVLKAGAAYLPINTDYPAERVSYMLGDSGCKMVLAQSQLAHKIKADTEILNLSDSALYVTDSSNPGLTCGENNLAYVIYTSGTTGNPKGVLIEHKSIAKTLQWRAEEYKLNGSDCVLQLFSYSFDGFLTSFFTPVISGAKVVLLGKNMEKDPYAVKEQIVAHGVTHFISVPVLYSAILSCIKPQEMKSLRIVALAGDKASAQLIQKSAELNPSLELVNEYGPTESSVVATIYRNLTKETNTVIGKPVANTRICILDGSGMLQPVGVPGELCIAGARLARGYLNRPDLTEQKFIQNPCIPGERLYKTGDVAKWLPDGNLSFAGRADFQVKIRGYRVEPAEIEAELLKHKAVKETVVLDRTDSQKNKYLCAYVVPAQEFTVPELRTFLLRTLPEYMVPAKFVRVEKIPLSANGKVDRKALPQPEETIDMGVESVKPVSRIEKELAVVWEEVLGVKNIGVNHNFFEIGGDSMSIVRLHAKLDQLYPGVLTVTDLFSYSTISKLAAYIKTQLGADLEQEEEAGTELSEDTRQGDIAIIGISVHLPLAKNTQEFWKNIRDKVDCVRPMPQNRRPDADAITKFRKPDATETEYEELAYLDEIDQFDCGFFNITPKEANLMDPNQRLFLQTAWGAIEDAGYGGDQLKATRTGVYVGFCGESEYGRVITEAQPSAYAIAAAGNLSPFIASRISYILDLKGPAVVINAACSSSLAAIHYACRGIQNGECDTAIAGGVKIWLNPIKNEFQMGIESQDAKTKTFDDSSGGTGKGEGVAAILLKPLKKAVQDNDSIYAVVKGSFVNQDGASNGITAPSPTAQAEVIRKAWQNAKIAPETIGYIEAHGTGTKLGDPIEIDGIAKAFRKYTTKKQFCAIGSVKSNMGHLDNAAGIVSAVKAALALKNRELPPTLHFNSPNQAIDFINSPVYVNDRAQPWEQAEFPRRCGVSSFGLSGTNCHLVLEEAPAFERNTAVEKDRFNVLTISANAKGSLLELVDSYIERYSTGSFQDDLADLCYTLGIGRGQYRYRAALILREGDSLPERLRELKKSIDGEEIQGAFYGEHKPSAALAAQSAEKVPDEDTGKTADEKLQAFVKGGKQNSDLLGDVCALYVRGAEIDWAMLYQGKNVKKIHAPTYPFLRQRCWFSLPVPQTATAKNGIYFAQRWDDCAITSETNSLSQKNLLVITGKDGAFDELTHRLGEKSNMLTKAVVGGEFRKTDRFNYTLNGSQQDYHSLLEGIGEIDTVVYLLSYTGSREITSAAELQKTQDTGAVGFLNLLKALDNAPKRKIEMIVISDGVNEVTGLEKVIHPENAVTFGIAKTIGLENKNIRCRMIDIDEKTGVEELVNEIENGTQDYQVAYRNGVRYVDVLKRVDTETLPNCKIGLHKTGVYLITGGTGRLGLEAARVLAQKERVNLALVSRTPLPPEETWDKLQNDSESKAKICNAVSAVKSLRALGAQVICRSCDITSEDALQAMLCELRAKYGKINGIIHCAAVGVGSMGRLIEQETAESFYKVLMPKVQGTLLLDRLTRQDEPDFFVMYSSGITLTSGIGSYGYTAANAYLDSYAAARSKSGLRTLTVNWPVFENGRGFIDESKLMFKMLPVGKGMEALHTILAKNISRVIVGEMNFDSEILSMEGQLPFRLCENLKMQIAKPAADIPKPAAESDTTGFGAPANETQRKIAAVCAEVLGYEKIGIYDDFFELGGHSLLAVEFISKLGQVFHQNITLQDLFENATVEKLANLFEKEEKPADETEYEEIEL